MAPVVIEMSKTAYPELAERQAYILAVLDQEELSFEKTINQGIDLLEGYLAELKESGAAVLPGEQVFKLHDTYGFPKDLTREIAAEAGFGIDEEGFAERMKLQREMSRKATLEKGKDAWSRRSARPGPSRCQCFGAMKSETEGVIEFIIQQDEETGEMAIVSEVGEGAAVVLVTDRTPFYANSGGQVGDIGVIEVAGGLIAVQDTTKTAEGVYLHHGTVESGFVKTGSPAALRVDREQRLATARNHTATHLMHRALRAALGDHVTQAGSSVNAERLRFDFHYSQPMSAAEIRGVEEQVNRIILQDLPVVTEVMTQEEAKASGATALFDEKYGDFVRVVSTGDFSREFCGGTHLSHTAQACLFKILSESSIASGVRRIEAVTCL